MSNKVNMSLVQAEVTFKIRVNSLIETEKANDENYMKEWFEDQGFKQLIDNSSDEVDVDYDNQVDVFISKETSETYKNSYISRETWKQIVKESKNE